MANSKTIDDRLLSDVTESVSRALREDVGDGDVTAALVPDAQLAHASIISRDLMVLAGRPWVAEVCRQIDANIAIDWHYDDGSELDPGDTICDWRGPARSILTAERTALNFLQLLSGTATLTAAYVRAVHGTNCRILDTRKTLPGLRHAQKYAVRCGGGVNHRMGLFDAILIKENHIRSAGGIDNAVTAARTLQPDMPIEVEAESLAEFRQALAAGADQIMLDNFATADMQEAVRINRTDGEPPAKLEASGGVRLDTIAAIAQTGVDYISVGALTKDVTAIDLSMRFR
ncbi:MAG: carboxylating nicotinate-nucleotide diphosphorylase [Gammaproteobacteria bacterium]|nr:carboxylating nicotinate-nucleotide diphosphorylase [Gammaproteobacteria bacterium]